MNKTHRLKCRMPFFEDVLLGIKPFEYRLNDRDFGVGDVIILDEINDNLEYTGRSFQVEVTYMLKYFPGLMKDYCIMAIKVL